MSKKERLNFDVTETTRQRIEQLRDETEAYSISEVIRRALATYYTLWEQKKKGGTIVIRSKDGDRELLLS